MANFKDASKNRKLNISLSDEVIERLDSFAAARGVPRSSVIALAVNQFIDAQEQLPAVSAQLDELKHLLNDLQIKKDES